MKFGKLMRLAKEQCGISDDILDDMERDDLVLSLFLQQQVVEEQNNDVEQKYMLPGCVEGKSAFCKNLIDFMNDNVMVVAIQLYIIASTSGVVG